MKRLIDKNKFGPWAIITGASSGIGEEFAKQLAADGFNLVLVARRLNLLEAIGTQLAKEHNIKYRLIVADLATEDAIKKITEGTNDLEIGLLISNAGTGKPGKFFEFDESELKYTLQLNAISHLSLVHFFGKKMAKRRKGGILLTGAMGAINGLPYMANEAGTKGYIYSLGKSLHTEFREFGLHITILMTPFTETPVLNKLGFTKENIPIRPLSVKQCVTESLIALSKNKITVIPGLKFRVMNALIPGSVARARSAKIMKKNNGLN
jgi:short-subunit dehydrogenase